MLPVDTSRAAAAMLFSPYIDYAVIFDAITLIDCHYAMMPPFAAAAMPPWLFTLLSSAAFCAFHDITLDTTPDDAITLLPRFQRVCLCRCHTPPRHADIAVLMPPRQLLLITLRVSP